MTLDQTAVAVVFATDDNYAKPLCVAIESVMANSDPDRQYRIFVLYDRLAEEHIALLEGMGRGNCRVNCINISHLIDGQAMYTVRYFSREMYFRLLIAEVLPQYEKALYLDCDTIALRDVAELYDTDMDGYAVGAVIDFPGLEREADIRHHLKLSCENYVNSGVLVINIREYQARRIKERILEYLRANRLPYPDQDALNVIAAGAIKVCDDRWNVQWGPYLTVPFDRQAEPLLSDKDNQRYFIAIQDPYIMHFTTAMKPWNSLGCELARRFWDYAKNTPVYDELLFYMIDHQKEVLLNSNARLLVLEQFKTGGIGFRYIIKFARAWLEFKLRRN